VVQVSNLRLQGRENQPNMETRRRRVFITVAEVSGDKHAAQLIYSLKKADPQIVVEGLGGPEMEAAGAVIHRNTVTKAAMGWRGALRAFEMMDALKWVRNRFDHARPDLQIGVDSPSLNFHFARVAHERRIPVLQYVAPQLWAWAPWRMKKLRKWVDRVACVLPFEEKYFQAHEVNATFVGHPLFDQLPVYREKLRPVDRFPQEAPVIGILPGSRKSEATANFPHMLEVARRIVAEFPGASFLVPTTEGTHPVVEQWVRRFPALKLEVGRDRFDEMVPRCDLCLTVSGTATLHVAAYGVPMIVVYRINPLQWNLAGRWFVKARTFALVNVLANDGEVRGGTHLVPEFVPWYGSNEPVAREALGILKEPEMLEDQRRKLGDLVATLDRPGGSDNVAKLALSMIEEKKASF
jgi:lipid-A-disaccharide synthase